MLSNRQQSFATAPPPHVPAMARNLPKRFYGRFDIRPTPDGGVQYSLPHTIGTSTLHAATRPVVILALVAAVIAIATQLAAPDHGTTLTVLHWGLTFLGLHGIVALLVMIGLLCSGWRLVTRVTIREDGLIIDDQLFFDAQYIHRIGYGATWQAGQPDELFVPRFEIDLGTTTVIIAEGLEVAAAKLFEHRFRDDVRRYFHGHN